MATGNEQDPGVSSEVEEGDARLESPMLRVVRGNPTPEELAALVGVVASMGGAEAPARRRVPEWSAPHRLVRRTLPHGPGGWRSSALPR